MLKEMTGEGCTIEDTDLLRRLRRKSAGALEEAVRQYGAYVMAVIRNRSRDVLTAEDQEEIASDVFVSLWRGAKSITRGSCARGSARWREIRRRTPCGASGYMCRWRMIRS